MSRDQSETFCWKSLTVLTLLVGLIGVSGLPAWAQRPTADPQDLLVHPEGFVPVKDLPRVGPPPLAQRERPMMFPDPEALMEMKAEVGRFRTQPPPSSTVQTSTTSSLLVSGLPAGGFAGLQFSDTGGYIPPDTQVAVGPNHIFEAVNLEGRIWAKDGTLVRSFDLNSFFGVSGSTQLSDPKVRFDPLSNRWFVAVITYNSSFTSGAWLLAVSTSDAPDVFVRYSIATSKSAPDFPALGMNDDKVILTANAFRGNSYVGTEFIVLNKANLVNGVSAAATYFSPPQGLFTIQPAHSLSTTCSSPSTCTLYMAAVAYNSATSLRVWSIQGVPGVGVVTATTKDLAIASLSTPPDAKQRGTSVLIQTNDNRLLDVSFRSGALWISANSACVPSGDAASRACLRFIKLSTATGIAKSQEFDFGLSGRYFYYPAIQIDGNGNLISVFSGSSSSDYASVYASGQKTTDPPNSFQLPVVAKAGLNTYSPFASRWGDYSGAGIDPADQSVVWVAGEYAAAAGGSAWGTWIVPLQMQ